MDSQKTLQEKAQKTWISLTGYRTLFVLKLLLEKSRTMDELVELLKSNPNTNKAVSKDTVRLTINTLRAAGCEISKLNKTSNYKYELYSHPFVLKFTDDELSALTKLRNNANDNLSWENILVLNEFFAKISKITNDDYQIGFIESAKIFADINIDVLNELSNPNLMGRKIQIKYNSPKNGDEIIDITVGKVSFTEGKLYLSCFNYKYNSSSLLSIDRIKEILKINISKEKEQTYLYEVEYELFGDSAISFKKNTNETIVKKTESSLFIKALVDNEFCFIQRLLLFGADFKIISPDSFREKLVNKIKLIQKGYENA